jgi:hypothetical protein
VTDITQLAPSLPRDLDGFHVETDAARERGDIILDRPPLNIITLPQREHLGSRLRRSTPIRLFALSYCGQRASIFRVVAKSAAFSRRRPNMFYGSLGILQRRRDV